MPSMTGRTAAEGISGGVAVSGRASAAHRRWLALLLAVGVVLAALVSVALTAPRSATAPPVASPASGQALQGRPQAHGPASLATRLPSGLAPAASARIGASDRSFWPVRPGSSLLAHGGGIPSRVKP